jgi:NAD(P)-dependent dehydrogenase (short-subunit alcohol dehydrogenase family)
MVAQYGRFSGNVLIVTGAGGGIGATCAAEFAARGAASIVAPCWPRHRRAGGPR